jgi:group II intron reverse transcriptase/maturase
LRGKVLTTLAHHVDLMWLYEAYRRTRKGGAVGVDGQTGEEYGSDLDANLRSLLERFHSGRYRAPAVRRVEIPKGDGRSRPIGIPTFEDKVLQRAVAMVLEAVYEEEFLDCSYGFRAGRSAHQALQALWEGVSELGGGWVIDLDIASYFDTLDHGKLREILDRRVRDGVIRRQIDKWLKAGVMSEGRTSRPVIGTPQGGVISPVLANIYLHEVLDSWFEAEVRPRLRGRAFMVRYADDAVLVFSEKRDAERVLEVLPKRFGRYGLRLHPEKTRLVRFERPPHDVDPRSGEPPGTFEFLGLTHFWGRSRRGSWVVKRKTSAARFRRAVRTLSTWLRRHRHLPVRVQQAVLCRALEGHYRYYGVTTNHGSLARLAYCVKLAWHKWLSRRSQRGMTKEQFFCGLLRRHPLPEPRCYASVYQRPPGAANLLLRGAG